HCIDWTNIKPSRLPSMSMPILTRPTIHSTRCSSEDLFGHHFFVSFNDTPARFVSLIGYIQMQYRLHHWFHHRFSPLCNHHSEFVSTVWIEAVLALPGPFLIVFSIPDPQTPIIADT